MSSAIMDIIVTLDNQASPEARKLGEDLEKVKQSSEETIPPLEKTSKQTRLLGAAANVAKVGVGLLGAMLVKGAIDAAAMEDIQAQLNAVIESTGGKAGLTADEVIGMAEALEQTTKFGADATLQGQNLLLTFTNIGEDVFPRATETMLDMATALGTDAASGAVQLGKALNDPVAGISALSRVGVSFTEQQKEQIKVMVESGDIMGAQTIILDELAVEFGGSATAAAETFTGRMEQVNNAVGAVGEEIAVGLLPILTLMAEVALPAIRTAAISMGEALEGLEGSTNALGGANAETVDQIIADNISHADSVDELIIEYEKIQRQMEMYGGLADNMTGTSDALSEGQDNVTAAIARESETLEDFLAVMQEVDPQIGLSIEVRNRELTVLYEHEQVMLAAIAVHEEEQRVRDLQTASLERMMIAQIAAADAEREAYEQTPTYIGQQEQLNEQMDRYATQLSEGPTVIAAWNEKQIELAEISDEATAAIAAQEVQLGSHFNAALTATEQTDSFEVQLYEAGAAAGLNADQLRILAGATGEYTEAEIEAAFQSALMKANIDELVTAVQTQTITAGEAVTALGLLKSGEETTAAGAIQLATDMSAGSDALEYIKSRAWEATTAIAAIPTTVNVHYTASGSVSPPGSIPGGGDQPQAFQTGGFTGRGASNEVAGYVHRNEFVLNEMATSQIGLPLLEALNRGTAVPGGGNSMVFQIDARGASNPAAVEEAGYRGAKRALQEAGMRADMLRRTR